MARIAVVDDEVIITTLLKLVLEAEGHAVVAFGSGEALLAELPRESFDLVVLDLNMRGLSGLDCLRRIRSLRDPELATTRILMLTGSEDDADLTTAHALGATGFLAKPFDPQQLVHQLETVLSGRDVVWMDDLHTLVAEPARTSAR